MGLWSLARPRLRAQQPHSSHSRCGAPSGLLGSQSRASAPLHPIPSRPAIQLLLRDYCSQREAAYGLSRLLENSRQRLAGACTGLVRILRAF